MELRIMNILAAVTRACAAGAIGVCVTGCQSTPTPPPPKIETSTNSHVQPGVPGGVITETRTLTANVTAVDKDKRLVTVALPGGDHSTFQCGPGAVNFDQIQVNDQVKVEVTDVLSVYLAGQTPPPNSAVTTVSLAPQGASPGGVVSATSQVTATVTDIDLGNHRAMLRFPDGTTLNVRVRDDVDLAQRKVGEQVVIRKTEKLALSVAKP